MGEFGRGGRDWYFFVVFKNYGEKFGVEIEFLDMFYLLRVWLIYKGVERIRRNVWVGDFDICLFCDFYIRLKCFG